MDGINGRDVLDNGLKKHLGDVLFVLTKGVEHIFYLVLNIFTPAFPVVGMVMNNALIVDIPELSDVAIHACRRQPGHDYYFHPTREI